MDPSTDPTSCRATRLVALCPAALRGHVLRTHSQLKLVPKVAREAWPTGPFSLQPPTNLRVGVTLEDPGGAWQQREDFHLSLLEDYFGESPQGSARSLDSVSDFAGLSSDTKSCSCTDVPHHTPRTGWRYLSLSSWSTSEVGIVPPDGFSCWISQ